MNMIEYCTLKIKKFKELKKGVIVMKKLWLVLGILFLSIVLFGLVGCGGVIPEPPPEIPLELIREYTGRDYVERWADGVVSVYDETSFEGLQGILDEINTAIDGPVVFFQLSDNTNNAQIKVIFEELDYGIASSVRIESNDVHEIINVLIRIDPSTAECLVYPPALLVSVGIKSNQSISQPIKTVLYWLYRLEPGYPLT